MKGSGDLVQPIPKREDILRGPARENATVAGCIQVWGRGACTWEEAMMIAVVMLARQVEANQARLVRELECRAAALVVLDGRP